MDRNIRTVDDVLRLLDELFAPEADRWTTNAGSCWWDSGRNALHLASAGFTVDAVDLSPAAITWAKDRAHEVSTEIHFHCGDASPPPRPTCATRTT